MKYDSAWSFVDRCIGNRGNWRIIAIQAVVDQAREQDVMPMVDQARGQDVYTYIH